MHYPKAGLALALLICATTTTAEPPASPDLQVPWSDTYHGQTVHDPYRWLEDVDSKAAHAWVQARNDEAGVYRKSLPYRSEIQAAVDAAFAGQPTDWRDVQVAGDVAALIGYHEVRVVSRGWLDGEGEEHAAWSAYRQFHTRWSDGIERTIEDVRLSPDGEHLAIVTSDDGQEIGKTIIWNTSRRVVVQTLAGGSSPMGGGIAWTRDGRSLLYTKYPLVDTDVPSWMRFSAQELWQHELGNDPSQDRYSYGRQAPRFAQVIPILFKEANWVECWDGDSRLSLALRTGGSWTPVLEEDEVTLDASSGAGTSTMLHYLSNVEGEDVLCRLTFGEGDTKSTSFTRHGSQRAIDDWTYDEDASILYVFERDGLQSSLATYDASGQEVARQAMPGGRRMTKFQWLDDVRILICGESTLQPPHWTIYDTTTGELQGVDRLNKEWPELFDDVVTETVIATSSDGTSVPMTVFRSARTPRDGSRPTIMYAYGGFGNTKGVDYQPTLRAWFDEGGVYAIAHPRGGGYHGKAWAAAGEEGRLQVTVDDVVACANALVAEGFTSPDRLALTGGSYGGLVLGAVISQQPDLAAVALLKCGVLDQLRAQVSGIGASLTAMNGDVHVVDQFEKMRRTSPYHHVAEADAGTSFPAIWLHGDFDDNRVPAWHGWKMGAALRASGGERPVLITTTRKEGHHVYIPAAERYAFYLDQMANGSDRGRIKQALLDNDAETLEKILVSGVSPDLRMSKVLGELEHAPLALWATIFSVANSDPAMLATVLEHGADVLSAATFQNQTLLQLSVSKPEFLDVFELLLDAGLPVDVQAEGRPGTTLANAVKAGQAEIVRRLISRGADVNIADAGGHTPLMWANSISIAHLLVEAGADLDMRCQGDETVLAHIVSAEHWLVARYLAVAGADPLVQFRDDRTLLAHLAYTSRAVDANLTLGIRWLLKQGIDVNDVDDDGRNVLMLIAEREHPATVDEPERQRRDLLMAEILLDAGIDPAALDHQGRSASDIARDAGKASLVDLILKKKPTTRDQG
jgi:prolyl oligopeptidase